jgi:transposase-like protein
MSLKEIFQLTDNEAFEIFKSLRWNDKVICPDCGCERHYFIQTRKVWQCKECKKQFSVTSGTIFAYHKLKLQDYLGAIAILSNSAKNHSMLQLSRDLSVQYKTAFVLSHKIREALMNHRNLGMMEGEIEIDASYSGGYIKPENRKDDRIDRRKAENQTGKKRTILTVRQRSGVEKQGAVKTLTFIIHSENQEDINKIIEKIVSKTSIIHADENIAYDFLHAKYTMKRVNHSIEYFNIETKACTNQAESYFSRLKRAKMGQHHKINPAYLSYYANEIAYREDTRRDSNGAIFQDIVYKAMHSPVSFEMCGYWQGNHRAKERLGV